MYPTQKSAERAARYARRHEGRTGATMTAYPCTLGEGPAHWHIGHNRFG